MARLVTHFALRPDEPPHQRVLQRHTGLTPRSLQIELARLASLGVVKRRPRGRRIEYLVYEQSPRWRLLRQLIRELAEPVDVIRDALTDVPGTRAAFVFGSFASGAVRNDSDVDLFLVTEHENDTRRENLVTRRTLEAAVLLGREVNVVAMTPDQIRSRIETGSGFLRRVLSGPKRWVVGDESALGGGSSSKPTSA